MVRFLAASVSISKSMPSSLISDSCTDAPTAPIRPRRLRFAARLFSFGIVAAVLTTVSSPASAGQSNSLMDISTDGRLLACSNRDSGTVTIVELDGLRKLREIPVGAKPEGVSFLGDSYDLAVAVYADDKVVFLNAETGDIQGETEVFDEPYGVVSTRAGDRVFVTLSYPGQIVEIDPKTKEIVRTIPAGQFSRGLALTTDETRLLVVEYYTAMVRAIDVKTGEQIEEWPGASTDNLARQITVHPTRPKAYLSLTRSRVTAAHGSGSIFPYVSVVDTEPGEGQRRKRIPMDAFLSALVVANPWEVAVSPDGKHFYAVFSGTDDMFACDILDDNYREISLRKYMGLGRNPRAVRVAPDSRTFYVYNALDFNVVAYDAMSLQAKAKVAVTDNPLGDEILQGKIHFYSAQQPMASRRWISCSSCHPDGDSDGRVWQNPEGLRATPPLFGLAWTHPLHWSADRDEVQDFEHTIRGPLMQGRGLIRGKMNAELGEPNKGLSEALDALAAYTNSHKFTLSPHAKGGLSEAAQRGREIFFSSETQCATCHKGPFYTDSMPGPEIIRHDVGTGHDDESEKMGPKYDTPTLLGVYKSAPHLHHGKAATLEDVLTTYNRDDKHGKTSHLTESQIADLVEFLKALPYEDPEPAAQAAGMIKVER
jgi:DNA-binding beta-propeller fold protein YncE